MAKKTAAERLSEHWRSLPPKPGTAAKQAAKKAFSEKLSAATAVAIAEELRLRGMREVRPAAPGTVSASGAERRISGGIGAKKVDVTWTTEESGLLVAVSIKSINFKDQRTGNLQKNLVNRRGDMLFEAVTLHRRFPYAVLVGLLMLDAEAETDATGKRRSTKENAVRRLALFTGRTDPDGREEQFEQFYIMLLDTTSSPPSGRFFAVEEPTAEISLDSVVDRIVAAAARRNPDFYEDSGGAITPAR